MKIQFTREALAKTEAGKLLANQETLSRKEIYRDKLIKDPTMIKRGYEHGWIVLGDRVLFVRSRWDGNIASYLQLLKEKGNIKNWFYEPETFWFKNVKRGTNSYKPDFMIIENDDRETYIEVKAYWMSKDSVKLARMKKYFPHIFLQILADDKCFGRMNRDFPDLKYTKYASYDGIKKNKDFIPGWGQPFLKREQVAHMLNVKTEKKPKRQTPPDLFNTSAP